MGKRNKRIHQKAARSWRLGRLPCQLPEGVETFHCITFSTAQKLLKCKVLQLPGIGWSDAWWSNQCVIITITITITITTTIMIMIATYRHPAKCSCQVLTSQRVILVHHEVSLWNCASCMQEPVTSIQFCCFRLYCLRDDISMQYIALAV